MKSYFLTRDEKLCEHCGACGVLLPEFIPVFNGTLIISATNMKQPEVKAAADSVVAACKQGGITLVIRGRDDYGKM